MHPKQHGAALLSLLAAPVQGFSSAVLSLEIGKVPPREKRLFKAGENDSQQGKFYFSKRSAELVMERAREWGNRFHFDWDHHAALTLTKGVKAPAAAWYDLESRDDGLWAINIDWTPPGKKDVEEELYKYLSPYFDYDSKTREVTKFNNAALTNLPALKQLEALTSITGGSTTTHEAPNMERKALLSALGLPETATDAEVASRVAELNAFKTQVFATTGAKSDFEAMSALLTMKGAAGEIETLKKRHEQEKADAVKKEREALLTAATEAGQLEPGSELRKHLEDQPVEVVKVMLSALPKKTGGEKTQVKGVEANKTGTATATLSQEQKTAARKMGLLFENKADEVEKHWTGLIEAQQKDE